MDIWTRYLDTVERQVRLDGFMTRVMHANLARIRPGVDPDTGRRIETLVARFHRPYALTEARALRN